MRKTALKTSKSTKTPSGVTPAKKSTRTTKKTTKTKMVSETETGKEKAIKPYDPLTYFSSIETAKCDGKKYIILSDGFLIEEGNAAMIADNILNCKNTLLLGPTSVGKTELAYRISKELGKDVTIFDMGTMLDPISGLVGIHAISTNEEGKTVSTFVPSRFSEAIQKPGVIILDEISRASLQANNLLFPVLDFRRELNMEYSFTDASPIPLHPECVFIATANVGSEYSGTSKLDRALLDRFLTMSISELGLGAIKEIVKHLYSSKLTAGQITTIVKCFGNIRNAYSEFKITYQLGIRHLKQICDKVANKFTIYDSFYVICSGLDPKGSSALKDILGTSDELKVSVSLFEK